MTDKELIIILKRIFDYFVDVDTELSKTRTREKNILLEYHNIILDNPALGISIVPNDISEAIYFTKNASFILDPSLGFSSSDSIFVDIDYDLIIRVHEMEIYYEDTTTILDMDDLQFKLSFHYNLNYIRKGHREILKLVDSVIDVN